MTTERCQCPMTGFFHFYQNQCWSTESWCGGVNALWRAFFISTLKRPGTSNLEKRVSMPYDGLFSFLRRLGKIFPTSRMLSVNALWRAFFISTQGILTTCYIVAEQVSMPYDGLFSFLLIWRSAIYVSWCGRCQCPMTGFFHFYLALAYAGTVHKSQVSMPYDGLFSFLLQHGMGMTISVDRVSMPYDGLFSFLPCCSQRTCCRRFWAVSMPYDGLFSFLRKLSGTAPCTAKGVNALWRAFFISTALSKVTVRNFRGCQCPMTGFFHFYTRQGY